MKTLEELKQEMLQAQKDFDNFVNPNRNNENLKLQINDSDLSIKDKLILMQKIGLNELLASNDYNKQEEKTLRQNLIAILEDKVIKVINGVPRRVAKPKGWVGGGLPSKAELQKMLDAIEIAKSKRTSKAVMDVTKARQINELKNSGKLAGDLEQLRQDINTRRDSLITIAAQNSKKDPIFSGVKAQIETAKRAVQQDPSPENKKILSDIEANFAIALQDYITNDRFVKQYVTVDKIELANYRQEVSAFDKKNWFNEQGDITPEATSVLYALINKGMALLDKFKGDSYFAVEMRAKSKKPGSLLTVVNRLKQYAGVI